MRRKEKVALESVNKFIENLNSFAKVYKKDKSLVNKIADCYKPLLQLGEELHRASKRLKEIDNEAIKQERIERNNNRGNNDS